MSLFRRIFSSKSKSDQKNKERHVEDRSKYMPEINLPVDESFMINFKRNGGKFLYCDNENEVLDSFDKILLENDWYETDVCCFDIGLEHKFSGYNLNYVKNISGSFFFATCEYLIADSGSILVSSNQLKEKKLTELPDNFVILASTSQLVKSIGEGLKGIKEKNKNSIPSNITTIKNFETQKEKDFLSYGSSSKNLYLLLLEDL
ncbi:LUD domain-containing protein [Aquimarina sp. MMG016]|uniref:LUD domain-containing protein n=1 Tax=Aquimarina sp. MMG016 TaxID=2822690 RepID=UPI001B3A3A7C|nr:LUD domain-containing protein [Aquimarina sp. MMG016]MBQ4820474.1 LUD domain-containing protein [Aquimarina sp. MMG016]